MIRACGWCRLFLGIKPPLHLWAVTHGLCRRCQAELQGSASATTPSPRALLILARKAPPVAAHLALPALAYLEPTAIVWDRRHGARRGTPQRREDERRQGDRRAAGASLWSRSSLFVQPSGYVPSSLSMESTSLNRSQRPPAAA